MNARSYPSMVAILLITFVGLLSTSLLVSSEPEAQGNPTEQQQTLDAAIGELFTQTAISRQQSQTLTATAAFQATIASGFQEALAATRAAELGLEPITAANAMRLQELDSLAVPDNSQPYQLVVSPDGTTVAVAAAQAEPVPNTGSHFYVFDLRTNQLIGEWEPSARVRSAAFSPDGTLIALVGYGDELNRGKLSIYDVATMELLFLQYYDFNLIDVMFSPDGSLLALTSLTSLATVEEVHLLDTETWTEIDALPLRGDGVVFNTDGSLLATSGQFSLWNLITRSQMETTIDIEFGGRVEFNPINSTVAVSNHNSLHIWDTESGSELMTLVHEGSQGVRDGVPTSPAIGGLSFTPDGTVIATSLVRSAENSVILWDAVTGNEIVRLNIYAGGIAFSSDGFRLVTAERQGVVREWGVRRR
jgi:WD40 repeat protein